MTLSICLSLFSHRIILNNMLIDMCLWRCTVNVLSVKSLSVHQFILKYWSLLFKGHWLGMVGVDWECLEVIRGGRGWLRLIGDGWNWLGMVGSIWVWLGLVGAGWSWLEEVGAGWRWFCNVHTPISVLSLYDIALCCKATETSTIKKFNK